MIPQSSPQILLIQSPRIWPRMPPLGIASLVGFLRSQSIDCEALDLNQLFYQTVSNKIKSLWEMPVYPAFSEKLWDYLNIHHNNKLEDIIRRIAHSPAPWIGFSVWHSSYTFTKRLIERLRQCAPHKQFIVGGPEVTLSYRAGANISEKFLFADRIIVGEGEQALLNILTNDDCDEKIFTFHVPDHLDAIPAPDFSCFSSFTYRYATAYPIWMNRGCIRQCRFCVEHLLCTQFRSKSPALVADEIERFYFRDGIQHFIFFDSLLNGNLKAFEELLDALIAQNLPIHWEAQILIRPDMPQRLFSKLKKAGCYNMFVGLESGSDRTLKQMRKGFTTTDASIFFQQARQANLHFEVSMIIGYPSETCEDIEQTKQFLRDNAFFIPKLAQINPYLELKGSPVSYETAQETPLSPEYIKKCVDDIVEVCKQNNIVVTPAYINNLQSSTADFDVQSGTMIM